MDVCIVMHFVLCIYCRSAGIGYTGYNYEAAAIVASTTASSKQSKDSKDHAAASLTFLHNVNKVRILYTRNINDQGYMNKYMLSVYELK
jgi:hypothetical protein